MSAFQAFPDYSAAYNDSRVITGHRPMVSALQQTSWTFEEFVAAYLEDSRYELMDGELIDLEPTGPHEKVAGFVSRKLNVQIDQGDLPWFIPMNCLIKPLAPVTGLRPDVVVLDEAIVLSQEPLGMRQPVITLGASVKLVVEVVSTNWQNDYARKVEEYEALEIPEFWIVDYLGLGGKRFIGWPKQPVVTIYDWVDGEYRGRQFRGDERLVSRLFPRLEVSADQVFGSAGL